VPARRSPELVEWAKEGDHDFILSVKLSI